MKERPILFSAPMVRAILAGTKTQTRRVVNPQPPSNTFQVTPYHHPDSRPRFFVWKSGFGGAEMHPGWDPIPCPFGQPGDRLWVRETWAPDQYRSDVLDKQPDRLAFAADFEGQPARRWRPSIHMPRSASRITLEINDVRVERLQEISEEDARAEGVAYDPGEGGAFHVPGLGGCAADRAAGSFRKLWQSINGTESWAANPWVWVIEFKQVQP